MKKQYIQPTTVAIQIQRMSLLSGSPNGGVDPNSSVSPGSIEAPSFDWDDEDEDEY